MYALHTEILVKQMSDELPIDPRMWKAIKMLYVCVYKLYC
jgi:hypothetical protein